MKATIEWREKDVWKQVKTEAVPTRNNNLKAKHAGTVLIFQNLQEGTPVLSPKEGKWIQVGRVTRYHTIFLGEGETYAEHNEKLFQGKWEKPVFA